MRASVTGEFSWKRNGDIVIVERLGWEGWGAGCPHGVSMGQRGHCHSQQADKGSGEPCITNPLSFGFGGSVCF